MPDRGAAPTTAAAAAGRAGRGSPRRAPLPPPPAQAVARAPVSVDRSARSSRPALPRAPALGTAWRALILGPVGGFGLLQRDADAFGVLGGPAGGRCDGRPAVEHVFTVVVTVPTGHRRSVRHVGGNLPERDDRIPAHQRRP